MDGSVHEEVVRLVLEADASKLDDGQVLAKQRELNERLKRAGAPVAGSAQSGGSTRQSATSTAGTSSPPKSTLSPSQRQVEHDARQVTASAREQARIITNLLRTVSMATGRGWYMPFGMPASQLQMMLSGSMAPARPAASAPIPPPTSSTATPPANSTSPPPLPIDKSQRPATPTIALANRGIEDLGRKFNFVSDRLEQWQTGRKVDAIAEMKKTGADSLAAVLGPLRGAPVRPDSPVMRSPASQAVGAIQSVGEASARLSRQQMDNATAYFQSFGDKSKKAYDAIKGNIEQAKQFGDLILPGLDPESPAHQRIIDAHRKVASDMGISLGDPEYNAKQRILRLAFQKESAAAQESLSQVAGVVAAAKRAASSPQINQVTATSESPARPSISMPPLPGTTGGNFGKGSIWNRLKYTRAGSPPPLPSQQGEQEEKGGIFNDLKQIFRAVRGPGGAGNGGPPRRPGFTGAAGEPSPRGWKGNLSQIFGKGTGAAVGQTTGAAGGTGGLIARLGQVAGPLARVTAAAGGLAAGLLVLVQGAKQMGAGLAQAAKTFVSANPSQLMHGAVTFLQGSMKAAGAAIGLGLSALLGPIGPVIGAAIGEVGSKLLGPAHKFIDAMDGLVDALGKYSPRVLAESMKYEMVQRVFRMRMAAAFEPAMTAWIQVKEQLLGALTQFAPQINAFAKQLAVAIKSVFGFAMKLATGAVEVGKVIGNLVKVWWDILTILTPIKPAIWLFSTLISNAATGLQYFVYGLAKAGEFLMHWAAKVPHFGNLPEDMEKYFKSVGHLTDPSGRKDSDSSGLAKLTNDALALNNAVLSSLNMLASGGQNGKFYSTLDAGHRGQKLPGNLVVAAPLASPGMPPTGGSAMNSAGSSPQSKTDAWNKQINAIAEYEKANSPNGAAIEKWRRQKLDEVRAGKFPMLPTLPPGANAQAYHLRVAPRGAGAAQTPGLGSTIHTVKNAIGTVAGLISKPQNPAAKYRNDSGSASPDSDQMIDPSDPRYLKYQHSIGAISAAKEKEVKPIEDAIAAAVDKGDFAQAKKLRESLGAIDWKYNRLAKKSHEEAGLPDHFMLGVPPKSKAGAKTPNESYADSLKHKDDDKSQKPGDKDKHALPQAAMPMFLNTINQTIQQNISHDEAVNMAMFQIRDRLLQSMDTAKNETGLLAGTLEGSMLMDSL